MSYTISMAKVIRSLANCPKSVHELVKDIYQHWPKNNAYCNINDVLQQLVNQGDVCGPNASLHYYLSPIANAQVVAGISKNSTSFHALVNSVWQELQPQCQCLELAGDLRRECKTTNRAELCILCNSKEDAYALRQQLVKKANFVVRSLPHLLQTIFNIDDKMLSFDFHFSWQAKYWGYYLFCHAGSNNFVQRALKYWDSLDAENSHNETCLLINGEPVSTVDELAIFKLLKCPFVEPFKRDTSKS